MKEELQKRTAKLAVEEMMIMRAEAGEEGEEEKGEEEDEEELPVIHLGKHKVVPFADKEDDDIDQLSDKQVKPKWVRFMSNRRHNFEGPVRFLLFSKIFILTKFLIVRSLHRFHENDATGVRVIYIVNTNNFYK